ncbi:hypothetical protein XENOCAPTIV_028669 [Xenoophorus captivus]|uniref:Uncharacterized protein n=1 Tax=Xenoophorus captivus TaxID=1517983 RepID=A0ABV0R5A8_9TELE
MMAYFILCVVFVVLGMAAAALKGRRRLEDIPQGPRADLTAGGEVVQGDDELVAFVADVRGAFVGRGLHHGLLVTFALALIGIQDLKEKGKAMKCGAIKDLLGEDIMHKHRKESE